MIDAKTMRDLIDVEDWENDLVDVGMNKVMSYV